MPVCPVCNFEVSSDKAICDHCGYDFNLKEIPDATKLKSMLHELKKQGKWSEEVRIKKQVTEIQKQKHGGASTTPNKGWSERRTAKFIGESHPMTSQDILLANELQKYPELLRCKKKSLAKAKLKNIKKTLSVPGEPYSFEREIDLQHFIIDHLDDIALFNDWDIVNGSVKSLSLLFQQCPFNLIYTENPQEPDETETLIKRERN